jgi:type I restriction enzyme S subunit
MIDKLKPYTKYKNSGLPWLDVVPEHWDMVPNRALMQDQRQVVGENAADYTLLSLTLRGIIPRNMENPKGKFPAQFNTYKVVRPEDMVFCLFDIDETPRGVGHSKLKGMITGAYDVFSPCMGINPRFLYLYYLFVDEGKLLKPLYTGLRKTIQRGVFASLKAPLPPLDEQVAIVRFLDHANRRIDRFIRAKKKVIVLLYEQKQSIIHRAVTRGLDPNAPLKPSGILWLGDIPSHWVALRAKYVFREVDERSTTGAEELLSVSHITGITPRSEKNITMFKASSYVGHKLCRPGDLVINTMWAWMAALGVSSITGIVSPAYAVYRPLNPDKLINEYIDCLLHTHSYVSEYMCRSTGVRSSRLRLYPEEFFKIPILLPPVEEQKGIVRQISTETADLSTAITRTEREIALLREYRTRLIADVVTGKIDVREAAKDLPDEAAESDIIDDNEPPVEDEEMTNSVNGEGGE